MNMFKLKFAFVSALTFGRIPLILIFLIVNLIVTDSSHPLWFSIGFGAMVLSALTDLFDGYFARKFKVETNLGAHADPLTDKIFYLVTLPTLIYLACLQGQRFHGGILLLLAIIFLIRDQWVTFLRSIGAKYSIDARANWSGKARTIISFPTICCIYWSLHAPQTWWLQLPNTLIDALEIISLAINLISMWVYTVAYWPCLKEEARIQPR